jgi:hypothetical protein
MALRGALTKVKKKKVSEVSGDTHPLRDLEGRILEALRVIESIGPAIDQPEKWALAEKRMWMDRVHEWTRDQEVLERLEALEAELAKINSAEERRSPIPPPAQDSTLERKDSN